MKNSNCIVLQTIECIKKTIKCIYENIERIFYIASVIGIGILFWYAWETNQLRITAEKQYAESIKQSTGLVRPFIGLAEPIPKFIHAENKSASNVATNVLVFYKYPNKIVTLDPNNNIINSLGPKDFIDFDFNKNLNQEMVKDEFCKEHSSLIPLLNYLFNKKNKGEIIICITYDDVLGHKLYTLVKCRREKPLYGDILETGYLKDLKEENK